MRCAFLQAPRKFATHRKTTAPTSGQRVGGRRLGPIAFTNDRGAPPATDSESALKALVARLNQVEEQAQRDRERLAEVETQAQGAREQAQRDREQAQEAREQAQRDREQLQKVQAGLVLVQRIIVLNAVHQVAKFVLSKTKPAPSGAKSFVDFATDEQLQVVGMEPAGFKARLRPLTLERNIDAHPPSIEAVRMLVVNALTMCGTLPEDEDIAFARLFLSRYSEIEKQFLL